MTLTIPSTHALQVLSEVQPGHVIATGKRQDLRTLNRNILRNFSANAASNLVVLSVPDGLTALTGSYVLIGKGKVRVWGNGARVQIHVFGRLVEARANIGGVSVPTATQGTGGEIWATGTALDTTGMSIDGDGFVEVEVYARLVAGPGTRYLKHVLIEELPTASGNMPGPGNADTDFISMHDDLYSTVNSSVDSELLQTLDDRVRQTARERSPRCLHLYARTGPRTRLSSAHWRLDGPYVVMVPKYADRVDVAITLEVLTSSGATEADVSFFALTEFERFEDVADARIQTSSIGDGIISDVFLGLKARAGMSCKVWVAFRCSVKELADDAECYIGHHSMASPEKIYIRRDTGLLDTYAPIPWGLALVGEAEDVAAGHNPAIKNALGYSVPSGVADIACINGLDPNTEHVGSDTELTLTISPHPGTGITTAPAFSPVPGLLDVSQMQFAAVSQVQLLGVSVEANVAAVVRSRRARARRGVSSGLAQLVMSRVNNLTVNCTPLACLRHGGQRLIKPSTVLGGGETIHFESTYLHADGAYGSGNLAVWSVPLGDPNGGASSGLLVRKLYGQVVLMVVNSTNASNGQEELATVTFKFSGGDEAVGGFKLRHRPNYGRNQSPTEADAVVSAWATHAVMNPYATPGPASPAVSYANAYTQTVTWPSEGFHDQSVWDVGPVFEMDIPESFPAIATVEIYPGGTARNAQQVQTVISCVYLWWGPREN